MTDRSDSKLTGADIAERMRPYAGTGTRWSFIAIETAE